MAPNKSSWVENASSHYPSIEMEYEPGATNNSKLKGTWSVAFMSSSTYGDVTFIPTYEMYYYYEYGD
jgi:hypothetical protein